VDELETRKQKAIEVCMMDSSTITSTNVKKRRESGTIKARKKVKKLSIQNAAT
jgi:hypothetical protein